MGYGLSSFAGWSLAVLFCLVPAAAEVHDDRPGDSREAVGGAAGRSFHTATGLLNRGLYDLAADEYRRFLSQHADHANAAVARYGLAVCLFRTEQHEEAIPELERLVEVTDFDYAVEVRTMLGRSLVALGRHALAVAPLEEVIRRHRAHDLADDAAAGLIEALYRCERYDDAISRARAFGSWWPDSPLRHQSTFYWGLAEMGSGDHAAAAAKFEELLSSDPEDGLAERARFLLGQCLEQTGRLAEAVKTYRRIVSHQEDAFLVEALAALAGVLHVQGELEESGVLLDRVLELAPGGSLAGDGAILRGRIWLEQGEFAKAASLFNSASDVVPERGDEIAYWVAKCALRGGEWGTAARGFAEMTERYCDSPLVPEASYDRSVAFLRGGRDEEAGQALKEFRSRFPQHELAAEALRLLAGLAHRAGEYQQSQKYCGDFLEKHPNHPGLPEVAFLSAENAYLAGELSSAIEKFRAFIERHAGDARVPTARFRIGLAAYRLGRFDEAITQLERFSKQKNVPEEFRAAVMAVGDIRFQCGEWKEAEGLLDRYLEGGLEVALADDALLKLGLCRQRQGEYEAAVRTYDRLLSRWQDSLHRRQAMFERGQALVQLGRHGEARDAFEAVLAEKGESTLEGYARYQLGCLSVQAGDFAAAVEHFERAERLVPGAETQAEVCFQRGQALMAAERYAAAQAAFEAFSERYGDHKRATEARMQAAVAVARQDRATDAVAAIGRLEKQGGQALTPGALANLQYEKAWSFRKLGEVSQAAEAYRRVLENPSAAPELSAHAMLELAELHFDAAEHEAAAELLRTLRTKMTEGAAPLTSSAREQAAYYLGICEFELGGFEGAAALLEEFLSDFPQSELRASAGLHCGEALLRSGRHEPAARHLTRVMDEFPDDPACGPATLRLGDCLAVLQRWGRSERVLSDYLERFGDSEHWFQAQFGVGWARENQKRYDEAIAAYRPVAERHHGETAARAQFQLGECLFAKKEYGQAVNELLKVDILYGYPEWSAAALYEAGRCFEELNKHSEAGRQFEMVQKKHPESKWAALASHRLASLAGDSLPGR